MNESNVVEYKVEIDLSRLCFTQLSRFAASRGMGIENLIQEVLWDYVSEAEAEADAQLSDIPCDHTRHPMERAKNATGDTVMRCVDCGAEFSSEIPY